MRVGEGDHVASIAAFTMVDDAPTRAERRAAELENGAATNGHAVNGASLNSTIPFEIDAETGEILDEDDDAAAPDDTDDDDSDE